MSNRHQELTSPEQTATGKDFPNPLIVDSLLKTIWSSMHHVFTMKHWLVQSKRLLPSFLHTRSYPTQYLTTLLMANLDFCDKHNMVAFLEKSTGSAGFHQIIDFITRSHIYYALTKKPAVCVSFIKQFWRSAEVLTDGNGDVKINATIDGHSLSITEGSLRRHLKLDDQDGITSLPTTEIFAQLALMGYTTDSDKLTFQKGAFSPQWRFLIHHILHCLSPKKTAWEQFSSNIAAAVICLATNRKFNFSRMIFEHMVSNISSPHKFLMYPRFIQLCLDMQRHKLQQHTRLYSVPSLTMKVFSNMKRSTKGFSGQDVPLFPTMLDHTEPSPSPSRITSSPSPTPSPSPEPSPTQPSPTQPSPQPSPIQPSPTQLSPTQPGTEYHPPTPHDSPLHVVHSHGSDEGSLKLQELMNLITTLSDRIGVLEADLTKTKKTYSSAYTKLILRVKKLEAQIKVGKARRHTRLVLSDTEVGADDSSKQGRKFSDEEVQEKASTATELFIQEVTPTEVIQDQEGSGKESDEVSTAGLKKGPVSEEVPTVSTAEEEPKKKSKKDLEQEQLSYAEAIRLEEQMNEEQRAQIARDEEIARQWDEEERKRAMDAAKSTKKIDWNDPSVIRYHSLKMKPKTIAQARRNMIKYLKNQGNYKISDFKGMSYNDIKPIFKKIWDFNQNIKPIDAEQGSKKQKSPEKERSTEKIMEEEAVTQEEREEVVKEPAAKRKKEEAPIEVESLLTKFPIVDWKTCVLTETFMYYQVFRGDGSSKNYKVLSEMLEDFDRMDVEELFRLPDKDDEIWRDQHEYNLLSCRLCDFCGIHILLMDNGLAIHMLTEKKYPLSQEMLTKMLSRKLEESEQPRFVYVLVLDINYFRHFLDILENYNPMDDEPIWAADRVVAPTLGSAITIPKTANEFAIKGNHLTLIKGNQFDGRTKTDPHKHIHEFLRICDMFKYRDTENEAALLIMFPLSLTGEAKTWPSNTDDEKFMARLDAMTMKMDAQYKKMKSRSNPISEYDEDDQPMIPEAEAKFMQTFRRTHFYNDYRDSNRDNWRSSGRNDYSRDNYRSNSDDKPYDVQRQLNGFVISKQSTNAFVKDTFMDFKSQLETIVKNHQASIQNLKAKFDRLADKQSARPSGSLPSNTQPNPKGSSSKPYQPPQARKEHVNGVFTRSGKSYDPPINPNNQPNDAETPVNFDSEDEEEECAPQPKPKTPKPVKETPIPKPYKPRIPYPQRLKKEKMEAQYGKFLDMIGAVRINVPLVDVLAGMPNYGKFLKELVSSKHNLEQISSDFLSDESSAMIQNNVPPKLGDPGSFIIPCTFSKAFSCNALANLCASINLMPYSLYAKLSLKTLKPTKKSVRLADRSFQHPIRIAENMLVKVGKFTFPVDFVILEMEEDSKGPLILGRPFLHTADAVIRVKQKQLNLGVGTEQMIFHIDSAMQHSYSNDDTCFSIDVIDEILKEDFDALLNKGSKILHSIEGTILEEKLFAEFDEFMAMVADENSESDYDKEEPKFEKITINTDHKIKTSLEEPLTDLELKPLLENLEYVFLEEPYFLLVIISSQLSEQNKNKLVFVLKSHKQAFSWKTTYIPGIYPSFCKHKIQLLDDKKPVVQKQR
ncbi:reverse transcriptase domain-containing protein [Tanacetum coccineum]